MDYSVMNNMNFSRNIAITNLLTCVYLPLMLYWLSFTDNLYNIGKTEGMRIEVFLALAELLKYFLCYVNQVKSTKKLETKNNKLQSIFKSVIMIPMMVAIFYTGAVLFGAPVFSKQQETFTFAIIVTVLTSLPCCLHLGPDNLVSLFTSITSFEGNEIHWKFLLNIQLTVFGAWLGAVIIPLDWNKPYQDWPIPCCIGAIAGCFAANFISLFAYLAGTPPQKTFKV